MGVDGTGSGSCPVAGFFIGVEISSSTITVMVILLHFLKTSSFELTKGLSNPNPCHCHISGHCRATSVQLTVRQ
jgi:hypothetical protein